MKQVTIILTAITTVTALGIVACNSNKQPSANREGIAEISGPISNDSLVKRGQYLVTIMGCNDCHSPKVMGPRGPMIDSAHLLSGHPSEVAIPQPPQDALKSWVLFSPTLTAFAGPWGTSFAANLTSDETGIGNWSEAQFFRAMREGKFKGMENGRPLLPPMPWEQFKHASDEDLKALFAFLRSTKPVQNNVPSPIPAAQLGQLN